MPASPNSGAGRGRARCTRRLLDRIGAGHPAVIGFDLLFTEPSADPADDAAFAAALQRNGPAIVPFAIGLQPGGPEADLGDPRRGCPRIALPRVARQFARPVCPRPPPCWCRCQASPEQASLAHVTVAADAAGQFHFGLPGAAGRRPVCAVAVAGSGADVSCASPAAGRWWRSAKASSLARASSRPDAGLRLPINYYGQGGFDQVSFRRRARRARAGAPFHWPHRADPA